MISLFNKFKILSNLINFRTIYIFIGFDLNMNYLKSLKSDKSVVSIQ